MVKRNIQNIGNNELLNLKDAAALFGYTQHHFGLLCRQNKLKAERVGKKWFTKKNWIQEYLSEVEDQYKNNNHYTNKERESDSEEFNLSKEKIGEVFPLVSYESLPAIILPPEEFIPSVPVLGKLLFGVKIVFACVFVFAFFVSLLVYKNGIDSVSGIANFNYESSAEKIKVLFEKTTFVFAGAFEKEMNSHSVFVANSFNNILEFYVDLKKLAGLKNIYMGVIFPTEDKVYRDIQSNVYFETQNFFFNSISNANDFYGDLKSWISRGNDFSVYVFNSLKNSLQNSLYGIRYAFVKEDQNTDYFVNLPSDNNGGINSINPVSPEEISKTDEGVVVLPDSFKNMSDEDLKREIQKIFSDEVVVKPDIEGDAGVIQPIFKKGKGDDYLYVMVPVEQKETSEIKKNI